MNSTRTLSKQTVAMRQQISALVDTCAVLDVNKLMSKENIQKAIAWAKHEHKHKQAKGFWLLSQNSKLAKAAVINMVQYGLELASGKRSGHPVCPTALTHGLDCLKFCIVTTGNGRFNVVAECRKRRTRMLFDNPELFLALLVCDIRMLILKCEIEGSTPSIRLNVFSDLPWAAMTPWLFEKFADLQFYDYTKEPAYLLDRPTNYHITLSYHEGVELASIQSHLDAGHNVAVVFDVPKGALPLQWNGWSVIDGDLHDLRFFDPKGVIVGLIKKGVHGANGSPFFQ